MYAVALLEEKCNARRTVLSTRFLVLTIGKEESAPGLEPAFEQVLENRELSEEVRLAV
jgi:hypothetical protein